MTVTILLSEVFPDAFIFFWLKCRLKRKSTQFPKKIAFILKPFHTNNNKNRNYNKLFLGVIYFLIIFLSHFLIINYYSVAGVHRGDIYRYTLSCFLFFNLTYFLNVYSVSLLAYILDRQGLQPQFEIFNPFYKIVSFIVVVLILEKNYINLFLNLEIYSAGHLNI